MRALILSCVVLFGSRIPGARPGPDASRRLRPSGGGACRQVRKVHALGSGHWGRRLWSARHDLRSGDPGSDAAEQRQSRPDPGSARLREGDRQRPSGHCRPQQQSHRPGRGLERAAFDGIVLAIGRLPTPMSPSGDGRPPRARFVLTKSEIVAIDSCYRNPRSAPSAGREAPRLFEKRKRVAQPQPPREPEGLRNFFYSNRSQPIEKSRFEKINASKLESIY